MRMKGIKGWAVVTADKEAWGAANGFLFSGSEQIYLYKTRKAALTNNDSTTKVVRCTITLE